MARKPPRRTRDRIVEVALRLYNEFGEPNVTTTVIADEMGISPGNLYYHFRNKDQITDRIFAQYEQQIDPLLDAPASVPASGAGERAPNVEDAWLWLHLLLELIWRFRFLYRDLNDLLSRNRKLEMHMRTLLERKRAMARWLCAGLAARGELSASERELDALATNMVVVLTYWLSYEYVRHARHFDEPAVQQAAMARGAYQVLALAAPYLSGDARRLFEQLGERYLAA